ncbi:MAG: hypothetical protein K0Q79_2317 [Flavipsychrobacter sp.]|jgi:hypothetical protein|nr:hypothetical protein [Flavipsychrobacter sp.]
MQKLHTLLLLMALSANLHAATHITSPTVSGHWVASGSPYHIHNTVKVVAGTTLTIDAGVEVIFEGFYGIIVNGNIASDGTAASPVNIHAKDTTGWSDQGTLNGGWSGIKIAALSPTLINGTFNYTNICDIKYTLDSGLLFTANNAMIKMKHCNIYHNSANHITTMVYDGTIMSFENCDLEMDHCTIYDNKATLHIINASSLTNIHDCTFRNNKAGVVHSAGCLYQANTCATTFTNNIVYDNECADGTISSIYTYTKNVLINGNKIYNNKNWGNAAINVFGGKTIIENNYVCNNTDDSASCGILAGGGGIHVCGEYASLTSMDTITKIIRNNIIANNQTSSRGSAIYVYQCNAAIVNNNIVNNYNSGNDGAISAYYGTNVNRLIIRNNIISGNVNGTPGIMSDIYLWNNKKVYLQYDHNWTQRNFAANIFSTSVIDSMIQETSVTTNVTGAGSAGMASPTLTANVTESALAANFSLATGSACINKGALSSYNGPYDYINNYRVSGSSIDIGAYEYGSSAFPIGIEAISGNTTPMTFYPNPASSVIHVTILSAEGEILLTDLSGRLLSRTNVSGLTTSLGISGLPGGMYFLYWVHETEKHSQKLIVE